MSDEILCAYCDLGLSYRDNVHDEGIVRCPHCEGRFCIPATPPSKYDFTWEEMIGNTTWAEFHELCEELEK